MKPSQRRPLVETTKHTELPQIPLDTLKCRHSAVTDKPLWLVKSTARTKREMEDSGGTVFSSMRIVFSETTPAARGFFKSASGLGWTPKTLAAPISPVRNRYQQASDFNRRPVVSCGPGSA